MNPDTPGKLLAHSVSYEALEEASYILLGTVAERESAEAEVADAAERIRAEETAMRERLEDCYDEGVDESLHALGEVELTEQVSKYLGDVHVIEEQAIQLLERASGRDDGNLTAAYKAHLAETRAQADAVEARLGTLGRDAVDA